MNEDTTEGFEVHDALNWLDDAAGLCDCAVLSLEHVGGYGVELVRVARIAELLRGAYRRLDGAFLDDPVS